MNKPSIEFSGQHVYVNGEECINSTPFCSIDSLIASLVESGESLYVVYEYVSDFCVVYLVNAFSEEGALCGCEGVDCNCVLKVERVDILR